MDFEIFSFIKASSIFLLEMSQRSNESLKIRWCYCQEIELPIQSFILNICRLFRNTVYCYPIVDGFDMYVKKLISITLHLPILQVRISNCHRFQLSCFPRYWYKKPISHLTKNRFSPSYLFPQTSVKKVVWFTSTRTPISFPFWSKGRFTTGGVLNHHSTW